MKGKRIRYFVERIGRDDQSLLEEDLRSMFLVLLMYLGFLGRRRCAARRAIERDARLERVLLRRNR